MPSTEPRGPKQIYKALVWSLKGMRAGWQYEASFRLEVYLTIVLFPLGLWLGHGALEKAMMCGSILLVLSAELLNSADRGHRRQGEPGVPRTRRPRQGHGFSRGFPADGKRRAVLDARAVATVLTVFVPVSNRFVSLVIPAKVESSAFAPGGKSLDSRFLGNDGAGDVNFFSAELFIALLTLSTLEIVLGVDNLVFISIAVGRLPKRNARARGASASRSRAARASRCWSRWRIWRGSTTRTSSCSPRSAKSSPCAISS